MAASYELWSFMQKFQHLSSNGCRAEMHLSSSNGEVWVNLQTEVGNSFSFLPSQQKNYRNMHSPSRVRRRERRRNARIASRNQNAEEVNDNEVKDFATVVLNPEESCLISFDEDIVTIERQEEQTVHVKENFADERIYHVQGPAEHNVGVTNVKTSNLTPLNDELLQNSPQFRGPSKVEMDMYNMLKHLTSRM